MSSPLSRRDVLKALGISIGGTVLPLSSWATNELGEKSFYPILAMV
ncbi:MAG: twin-arginine translocation signal domain-containing protein [Flavobacteriales bacterium]|nr:twin-arginine translocation signal domain-containing protein [Flavobacteriales bacterium]